MVSRIDFEKDRRSRLPKDTTADYPPLVCDELRRAARSGGLKPAPKAALVKARAAPLRVQDRMVLAVKEGTCSGCGEVGRVSLVEANWGMVTLCPACLKRSRVEGGR